MRAHGWRKRATVKRVDAEAIQIKDPRVRRRASIKKADAKATQIKGPQREEKGDNNENISYRDP